MKNISARLKEKMDAIKNDKGNINTSVVNTELKPVNPFDSLYSEEDFSYINEILEEEDLREFLKDRTKKLLIQKDFTVIFLGDTLEEVFQKIGNHKNGTYQKWLHLVGINERTALRYRNKANLFKKAISFNAKKVIFELSHDNIQVILDNKDIEEKVLNAIENGANKKDIQKLLTTEQLSFNIKQEKETFEKDINLEPGEIKEIKISVKLGKNNGVDRVSISANAELYDEYGQKIYETNPITQIVEKNSDTRRKEDLVRQGKLKLTEEEMKSLGIAETRQEEQKLVRNYEISGKAWDDINKNGVYDEGERPLANIVAKLVENGKNRVIKTVLTDDTGKYTFSEVPNGEYSVMFEFEDKKYSPTVYKKNNVEDSKVSDAIGVNRQETTKQVAVSDAIKINFQSKSNENLGLVNNTNFDMALKGEITKLRVVNGDKKDEITTKEVESTVNKFKVSPFTSGNSKVEVDYKLIAKNEGNVPGKIVKIGAYKNKEEKILTASWKQETGELAVTRELENIELKPGEEKEITVTVETTMDKVMNKVLSNRFEILETSNNLGLKDINSVEGNNSTNENDNVALDVIVNRDYTLIIIAIIAAIAGTLSLFREKIMKLFKKEENTKDNKLDEKGRKEEANDKE